MLKPWTLAKVKSLPAGPVKDRLRKEVTSQRKSPVTGSLEYWKKIVQSKRTNYRLKPHLYRIGKGEQGVLSTTPYTQEIVPYWRFKTEAEALVSADMIYSLFEHYNSKQDFVGADIAKKFLQMGFTRARRYANYPSGRKYIAANKSAKPAIDSMDGEKAWAASIFKMYWDGARADTRYLKNYENFLAKIVRK